MPESTLSLALSDLQQEVGFYLGFGRGTTGGDNAWTAQQQNAITSCVKSGLRMVYWPTIDGLVGYDWSFLRPLAQLTLTQGVTFIPLPDDFGSPEGEATVKTPSNTALVSWPVRFVNPGYIREQFSLTPQYKGRPQCIAVEAVKGTTGVQGQRWQLLVFPIPDNTYTLQFTYYLNPDALTGAAPYTYGGPMLSETILEACLSVAERRLDDAANVHMMAFQERIRAAVAVDRRNKPQMLGYNGDRSDIGWRWPYDRHFENYGGITYNGRPIA